MANNSALTALLPAIEAQHDGLALTSSLEAQYLSLLDELPSLTLEGIKRRPAQARATASGLKSQLLELANGSCAAFVESADCVKRVHEKMTHIAGHLAQLETVLPSVGVEADGLLSAATDGIGARGANTLLLERLTEVLEVLEQPQLMDACAAAPPPRVASLRPPACSPACPLAHAGHCPHPARRPFCPVLRRRAGVCATVSSMRRSSSRRRFVPKPPCTQTCRCCRLCRRRCPRT